MEAFVDGQDVAEGFGNADMRMVAKDDPVLPLEVRDFVPGFDTASADISSISDKVTANAK